MAACGYIHKRKCVHYFACFNLTSIKSGITKAAVVADMSESGVSEQCLTINVAGMSWPVRYSEVATLAQEF